MPNKVVHSDARHASYVYDNFGRLIQEIPDPMQGVTDNWDTSQEDLKTKALNIAKNLVVGPVAQLPKPGSGMPWDKIGKDLITDAASQAVLMLPGVSMPAKIAKAASSLGAGYFADQLQNPEKSGADSFGNAALNTTLGMAMPGITENSVSWKPSVSMGASRFGKFFGFINPSNIQLTPRPAFQALLDKTANATQQALGSAVSGKPLAGQILAQHIWDRITPSAIGNMLKGLIGFGSNAATDLTINRPDNSK